jgi:hypothetical protein
MAQRIRRFRVECWDAQRRLTQLGDRDVPSGGDRVRPGNRVFALGLR